MSDNYKFKLKIGEVGKRLEFTVKDGNGAAVDLTDKTVKFSMSRTIGGTPVILLEDCEADGDQTTNTGEGFYEFGTAANGLTAGNYYGELCVIDGGGNALFYPNEFTDSKNYILIEVSKSLAVPS